MLETVEGTIRRHKLLPPGERIVVGVSGGPDSVALLHVLLVLAQRYGWQVSAAHLNHGLRGQEAAEDEALVRRLAAAWGVPLVVAAGNVPAVLEGSGRSPEEVARQERYLFLRRVCREVGATSLAVGHHADDQAETVLLHLLWGAGSDGLGGMWPRRGLVVRPFLELRRQEIEAYCHERGLPTRQDASNQDRRYLRNRIRLEVLPVLSRLNPGVVTTLNRTTAILREESRFLENEAQEALKNVTADGGISLAGLQALPLAIKRRVLRLGYASACGSKEQLGFGHVEQLLELVEMGSGALDLPGGIRARVYGGQMVFQPRLQGEEGARFFCYPLPIPGEVTVPELGLVIKGDLVQGGAEELAQLARAATAQEAWLDWDSLPRPLQVRRRLPGDRWQPLGLTGTKKLKDFFNDAGVIPGARDRVPLVTCPQGLVWVVGYRPDNRWRVGNRTRTALHLTVKRNVR